MVQKLRNSGITDIVIYHSRNVCAAVTHGLWYDTNVRLTFVPATGTGVVALCQDGELVGTDWVLTGVEIAAGWGWEIDITPGVRYRFAAVPNSRMLEWVDRSGVFGSVGVVKRDNTR